MDAVMGITGKVGGALARALLAQGRAVRAVVREVARGQAWEARGCAVAVADLADVQALTSAFTGAEGVFAMLPPLFDPSPGFPEARALSATLRSALVAARPQRVVVLSTIGADVARPNLLNQLRLLEQALVDLPMPVAFLRPAWFMENAAWDVATARDQGLIRSYLQPLGRPVPMIATDDVGRLAGELLRDRWQGVRVVELEAAARVTPHAIARAFADALGRPVRSEVVPRADWEAIFRREGMRNPTPRIEMLDGFNQGWIDFPDRGQGARKGAISIEQAVRALVAAGA